MRTGVITREPLVIREAVALGLGWGVFCGIANGWPVASTLAQMAVPWVWAAALAGYRAAATGRQAAVLGGVTLLAANVGYFAIGMLARNIAGLSPVYGIRFFVLWTAVGLVIGPVAGVVGWWLTTARAGVGVVALAIVSIAEPLALWAHLDHFDAHLAYVAVAGAGLAFPLVWFRRVWRTAATAVASALVLAYPAAVTLEVVLIALGQISAPMRLI